MSNFTPIVLNPIPTVSGLRLAWGSNSTLTVTSGQTLDVTNSNPMVTTTTTTIDAGTVGLNGIDTGALANSTIYNVFMVGDASGFNAAGFILSTSEIPLLPTGVYDSNYGIYKKIGFVITDGSAHIRKFYQFGTGVDRRYEWDTMISVASAVHPQTYTSLSLALAVPPINTVVRLYAGFTPATAANLASFRPTGSSATTVFSLTGAVASVLQASQFEVAALVSAGNASIDYLTSASGDSLNLSVLGYLHSI